MHGRTMMFLTGVSTPLSRHAHRRDLGVLTTPVTTNYHEQVRDGSYRWFGADNGFFSFERRGAHTPAETDEAIHAWLAWVREEVAPLAAHNLFVSIPDVLHWPDGPEGEPRGDAEATLERYPLLAAQVRRLGLTPALVAQNGLHSEGRWLVAGHARVPWSQVPALFIGGSTDFKLGPDAMALIAEANRRHVWVHVGRVNTKNRFARFFWVAQSADGTCLRFGPAAWERLTRWFDEFEAMPTAVQTTAPLQAA